MSEPKIPQNLVYNTEIFEFAKDIIICSICKGILIDPVQCRVCLSYFCHDCADIEKKKTNTCPVNKCIEFPYSRANKLNDVIKKLKFKCKNGCEAIINYIDLKKHYDSECTKMNYVDKYIEQMAKYNKLVLQMKEYDKKLQKISVNSQHIKDVDYYINNMQHHPSVCRQDWDYLRNKMNRNVEKFKSFYDTQRTNPELLERRGRFRDRIIMNSLNQGDNSYGDISD